MPTPQFDWSQQVENPLIAEQLDYDTAQERALAEAAVQKMNAEQRDAFDRIVASVEQKLGKGFFLNGAGGTGKTFVYSAVTHHLRGQEKIVLCAASSGISALLLPGGRTAHSMFKIPIDGLTDESTCAIPKESQRAALIRAANLTIWDEAMMHHRHCHEALDRTFRDICGVDRPYGGKTMVFGSDPKQTLPVVPKGTQEEILDACLQRSYLWSHLEMLTLTQNMRLEVGPEEVEFGKWLLDIGYGRANRADGTVDLPSESVTRDSNSLIDFIYPGIDGPTPPPNYFLERTILAARTPMFLGSMRQYWAEWQAKNGHSSVLTRLSMRPGQMIQR